VPAVQPSQPRDATVFASTNAHHLVVSNLGSVLGNSGAAAPAKPAPPPVTRLYRRATGAR
ncbi:MAG: hypothetical protein MI806_34590, partial [Minwuiales bacterium]|nr:hypothetical protein [Minwuiales bacterium]